MWDVGCIHSIDWPCEGKEKRGRRGNARAVVFHPNPRASVDRVPEVIDRLSPRSQDLTVLRVWVVSLEAPIRTSSAAFLIPRHSFHATQRHPAISSVASRTPRLRLRPHFHLAAHCGASLQSASAQRYIKPPHLPSQRLGGESHHRESHRDRTNEEATGETQATENKHSLLPKCKPPSMHVWRS